MPNLSRRYAGRWMPDADATTAPDDALLRADNTVPDEVGARALRKGTKLIYGDLLHDWVQTLMVPVLQGTMYRMAGIDDRIYRYNSLDDVFEDFGTTVDGTGDMAFADDSYQIFIARGNTRKKFDGTTLHDWEVAAPVKAPTLTAVAAVITEVGSFNGSNHTTPESPAFTQKEGTMAFDDGYDGSTEGGISLLPDATGRASATKKWSADQNHFDILGTAGGDTDLFDVRGYLEDPRVVDKVTVMFGLGTGNDAFQDDYYYFDWNLRDKSETDVKDAASQSVQTYLASTQRLLMPLTPQEITGVKRPEDAQLILKRIGKFAGSRSVERRDSSEASPAWGHFTCTRGQFTRVGSTAGRNWKTVRAMKVIYTVTPGQTKKLFLDNAVWAGGGQRALSGRYRLGFRWARKFENSDGEIYTELSPMSPISAEISLNQQGLQFTVDSGTLLAKPLQANQMWVYLFGGFMDTYYRAGIYSAFINQGMTIDELTNPSGTNFNLKSERVRLTTHGFTRITGGSSASADLTATINKSELSIMIENEVFEPGVIGPPANIISVCGPWNGRMFVLTSEGWLLPSSQRNPSGFSVYHAIDLRKYGTPYWCVMTASGGIYAGCSKDVVRIAGSGDEDETHVHVDLYPDPLLVANPPVDRSVAMDGNTILYRSADGLMILSGGSLTPFPTAGTSLLWRGHDRHDVPALNTLNGRFRYAFDNHNLYAIVTEGTGTTPTALWKYLPAHEQWCRFTYKSPLMSLFREQDGKLLAGTNDGQIWEIESATQSQDETESETVGVSAVWDIDVDIQTPWDDGKSPYSRKEASDYQIHALTMGESGSVEFFKDGSMDEVTALSFATGENEGVYRSAMTALGKFLRVRQRISGAFNRFLLHMTNITYRPVPQEVMVYDPGYILPVNGGEMSWVVESEIDCVAPANLTLNCYKDDVLAYQLTVPTRRGRSTYITTLRRGSKAARLRITYSTTLAAGVTNPGFEPYGMRVRHHGSGAWITMPTQGPDVGNI